MPTSDDARAAAGRIAGVAHRMPVPRSRIVDELVGAQVFSPGEDFPLEAARLCCDLPSQSVANGECQHVASLVADGALTPAAIGDVLTGHAAGRRSPGSITGFDNSGVALQDLAVATAPLDAHDGTTGDETT